MHVFNSTTMLLSILLTLTIFTSVATAGSSEPLVCDSCMRALESCMNKVR